MASDHPFQMLFETFGRLPTAHAESVNKKAFEQLTDVLSVPVEKAGRCILLRAPRAGHGKTHLLSRVQNRLGNTHEFIPLQAASGYRIDAASVIDDTLRRLVRALPASGGLSILDLVTRRLFSHALQPLVKSGEVPCQDREGALAALQNKPVETFDFHHPNAVTAHWARENFEVLGPRLSLELSQRSDLPLREVSFWVNALFRFASTQLEDPTRARVLSETVFTQAPVESDGDSMERLSALLGLLTSLMRVVLVADDLEGFSADETAALRFAAFLGSLRQSVERLDVILSLNQDIWKSAFVPRLSGGLADRLSEVVIELEPLKEEEMVALLESRVPGMGRDILDKIQLSEAGTHSRGLIRAAAVTWDSPAAFPPPVPVVAPVFVSPVERVTPGVEEVVQPLNPPPAEVPVPVAEAAAPAFSLSESPVFTAPPESVLTFTLPERKLLEPQPLVPVFTPQRMEIPEPTPVFQAPPEQEPVPVDVLPEPEPVRIEPEIPEFRPFSVPQEAPAIEVASHEVERDSAWPAPTFSVPVENPFARFAARETSAPAFHFEKPATPVQPTQAVPVPAFRSPFQMEAPEPIAAPAFQSPAQPAAQAPQPFAVPASPAFQVPPAPASAFVPASIVQEATPAAHDSPYGNSQTASFEPAPQPASKAPAPEASSVPAADTDRVDELLRQFRERYGRGGL